MGFRNACHVAVAVAVGWSVPVHGAVAGWAPGPETTSPGPGGPDLGELWRDAQARLGTADYAGAIDRLTTIYEAVVQDPDAEALRRRVRWALHEAHVGAYRVDGDPSHLYVARDLLDKDLEDLPAAETDARARAEAARKVVLDEIAAYEASHPVLPEPEPQPEPEPELEPEPESEPELDPVREPRTDPTTDGVRARNARPLLIAGATLLGVGAVGAGLLLGGFLSADRAVDTFVEEPEARDDARRDVARGNAIGIAGGVIAGVGLVSGAALMVVWSRSRKHRVTPSASATTFGLTWSGRF
jgi:hypothetical protein